MYVPTVLNGARAFVDKHPEWDGRGVTIAVVDTGVDAARGCFRRLAGGGEKLLDCVDVTGDGDVRLAGETEARSRGGELLVTGASGRTLKLNAEWKNPSGKWRFGCRRLFDMAEKTSAVQSGIRQRDAQKRDAELSQLRSSITDKLAAASDEEEKKELKHQLDSLDLLKEHFPASTAVVDIVSWHDGKVFRAVLSTDTDLSQLEPMTDFRREHQVGMLSAEDSISFTLNFYEEGQVVSVVVPSTHGSHCASIACAYEPDEPELNGVAPGARLLSVRIGQVFVTGTETHSSVERLVQVCIDNQVDIISMSFGESCYNGESRFGELLKKAIVDHGIIFCTSAGNEGFAHLTGGQPEVNAPHLNVGAFFTSELGVSSYGHHATKKPHMYRFSSRGPSLLRGFRANVVAPGGANTFSVGYEKTRITLKNGTSMACPNAAGCVALVLSALKQQKIPYTPWSIVRAAEDSASVEFFDFDKESWADFGCGLLRPLEMLELIQKSQEEPAIPCAVVVEDKSGLYNGMMIHGQGDAAIEQLFTLKCLWPKDTPVDKILAWSTELVVTSDQPWITNTPTLSLSNDSSIRIKVTVDPRGLKAGKVHFGCIIGRTKQGSRVFSIPVSYFFAQQVDKDEYAWKSGEVTLEPAAPPYRALLNPPLGATHFTATFSLEGSEKEDGAGEHSLYAMIQQLMPGEISEPSCELRFGAKDRGHALSETRRCSHGIFLDLGFGLGNSDNFPARFSCEIKFWSFQLEGTFLNSATGEPTVFSDMGPSLVSVRNLSPMVIRSNVSANLNRVIKTFLPTNNAKPKLGNNRFPITGQSGPISEMRLHYSVTLEEDATVCMKTPLSSSMYENQINSIVSVYRSDSKELVCTSVWGEYPDRGEQKLAKGTYFVENVLQHPDPKVLVDHGSSDPLRVSIKVKSVPLYIGTTRDHAMVKNQKLSSVCLFRPSSNRELWISPSTSLPKTVRPGDLLFGSLRLGNSCEYPLTYVVQQVAGKDSAANAGSLPAGHGLRTVEEKLQEVELKSAASYFESQSDSFSSWDRLATDKVRASRHLPLESVNQLRLVMLRAALKCELFERALTIAEELCSSINQSELAQHFGMLSSDGDERARMTARRNALIEALLARFRCASLLKRAAVVKETQETLSKWLEAKDKRYLSLYAHLADSSPGSAAWSVLSQISQGSAELDKETLTVLHTSFKKLNWTHFACMATNLLATK